MRNTTNCPTLEIISKVSTALHIVAYSWYYSTARQIREWDSQEMDKWDSEEIMLITQDSCEKKLTQKQDLCVEYFDTKQDTQYYTKQACPALFVGQLKKQSEAYETFFSNRSLGSMVAGLIIFLPNQSLQNEIIMKPTQTCIFFFKIKT